MRALAELGGAHLARVVAVLHVVLAVDEDVQQVEAAQDGGAHLEVLVHGLGAVVVPAHGVRSGHHRGARCPRQLSFQSNGFPYRFGFQSNLVRDLMRL
jgi:hypothetical protein